MKEKLLEIVSQTLPEDFSTLSPQVLEALFIEFDKKYYLSGNSDVAAARVDPVDHFVTYGYKEKRAPNEWFNAEKYTSSVTPMVSETTNPFLHLLARAKKENKAPKDFYYEAISLNLEIESEIDDRIKVSIAINEAIEKDLKVISDHFDKDYYLSEYPEVKESGVDPVLHFVTIGWIEGKNPNEDFSVSYYLHKNGDIKKAGVNPFVHYIKAGFREKWRAKASVEGARILMQFEPGGELAHLVQEAAELDPMVNFPRSNRAHISPLERQEFLVERVEKLRKGLLDREYDYVVAIPHIRMSGAARVAAIFTTALAEIIDPSRILVLVTDSSEMPYQHWFPKNVAKFDMSMFVADINETNSAQVLIDVLRGVNCQTVININSRLAWDTFKTFGRQMSQEMRLASYLFTWDETPQGFKGGYPIQWLRQTCEFHHCLFTDTKFLAADICERFGYTSEQVISLYTPIEGAGPDSAATDDVIAPRFLWAGRFDRQKRVDVLVKIARQNPNVIFDVYGKPVLDSAGLERYSPPSNIIYKETYSDLSEVLSTPYSGFVYTAQWDGLPTILLDVGAAGLPIVAPAVGGVPELIDQTTGWLIPDCEDVNGYSSAIQEIIANPKKGQERAQNLQNRMHTVFSKQNFLDALNKVFNADEH